ncbi:MAG: glycosyltransferase family 87 protein [Thermoguttaceae bacterium]
MAQVDQERQIAAIGPPRGLGPALADYALAAARRAKPWALPAAIALGLTAYVAVGLYNELQLCKAKPIPSVYLFEDHGYYTTALTNALAKEDPYETRDIGHGFLYPPTALLVIEPFHLIADFFTRIAAYLDTAGGNQGNVGFFSQIAAYTAVNLALVVLMVYGVGRCYGHGFERTWYLFPLALGFSPLAATLHVGQINVITEFGIFLAFAAETALPAVAGAGLALAICTKVTPVAFLGYYLVNMRLKAIAATLIAVAVLSAIAAMHYGWAPFATYWRLFPSLLRIYAPESSSLVARLCYDEAPAHAAQAVLTAYVMGILLLAGVCGFLTKQREPLFILVCLAAILSPNIVWYHHFVFFLLPLLVWMAWSNFRWPVVLWCCGGFALIQYEGISPKPGYCVHVFGHVSMLLLLLWQVYQVCGRWRRKKFGVRS